MNFQVIFHLLLTCLVHVNSFYTSCWVILTGLWCRYDCFYGTCFYAAPATWKNMQNNLKLTLFFIIGHFTVNLVLAFNWFIYFNIWSLYLFLKFHYFTNLAFYFCFFTFYHHFYLRIFFVFVAVSIFRLLFYTRLNCKWGPSGWMNLKTIRTVSKL